MNDSDQVIITLLATKLREKNFYVTTSQNFYSNVLDFTTKNQIDSSHLFIGIITNKGHERKRVIEEWRYAHRTSIPCLLLIEDTIKINSDFKSNYVKFNRRNPRSAINEINRRMDPANVQHQERNSNNDVWPWVIGGAALLAVIGLLSGEK